MEAMSSISKRSSPLSLTLWGRTRSVQSSCVPRRLQPQGGTCAPPGATALVEMSICERTVRSATPRGWSALGRRALLLPHVVIIKIRLTLS